MGSRFDTEDSYAQGYYPDTTEDIIGDVWFVPLISTNRTNDRWFHAAGLVVTLLDENSGCYRRVGYFNDIHDFSWMIDIAEQDITLL